jgi:hypothetical protein
VDPTEQVRAEVADDLVLVAGADDGEDGQVDPGERAIVVEHRDSQSGGAGPRQPLAPRPTVHRPLIRRWECTVMPASARMSRCLPRGTQPMMRCPARSA